MTKSHLMLITAFSAFCMNLATFGADQQSEEAALEELLKRIPKTADEGAGMNDAEQALARAIAKHGIEAADALTLSRRTTHSVTSRQDFAEASL